ncbi:MAG: hypothetical protein AAFU85_11585 [Planctomycetota bacterium]
MTIYEHKVEQGSPTGGAGTGARQYKATVWCFSDDCGDTGEAVLQYLIDNGFTYGVKWEFGNDSNERLRLFQISPPRFVAGSQWIWRVELSYAERKLIVATSEPDIDPTDFLPEITVRTVGRAGLAEEALYFGGLDDAALGWTAGEERTVTNSAGTPIALDVDDFNGIVHVTRRTVAVTADAASFPYKWINSEAFTLSNGFITVPIGQYQIKFSGWEMDREQYEGFDLVRVEFTGEINPDGWLIDLLDKGVLLAGCGTNGQRADGRGGYYYGENDPENVPDLRHAKDRDGVPLGEEVFLDGAGNARAACSDEVFYGRWGPWKLIDPRTLGFFAGITS